MSDANAATGKKDLERLADEELRNIAALRSEGRELSPRDRLALPVQDMPCQDPAARGANMLEVAEGYGESQARIEAERCLDCKNAPCMAGCPVRVDIPGFIKKIREGDYPGAARAIKRTNLLPSVCGRVCPQETQCQATCTLGKSLKSVDKAVQIGRLERWVADRERACGACDLPDIGDSTGKKIAVVKYGETNSSSRIGNIFLIDPMSGAQTQVSQFNQRQVLDLQWSLDSQWIFCNVTEKVSGAIWAVSIKNGESFPIAGPVIANSPFVILP